MTCPNCEAPLADARYCPDCGQRQGPLVPSVWTWLRDALEETLFIEGRLPRTLKRLFRPPGALTREWRRGRRASYVHPLRLYLLAAAFFFVPWTLTPDGGLLVGYVIEDAMQREGVLPGYGEAQYRPAAPLSPAEMEDPEARARWRAAFEERRGEARTQALDETARIRAGVQRVTDLLPVLVGLLLVPVLAGLSYLLMAPRPWREEPARARSHFMEHLVLSTHVHAVGYLVFGALVTAAWLAGGGDLWLLAWPVGFAAVTWYLAGALRMNFGGGPALLLTTILLVPVLYIFAFWTVSWAAIRALVKAGVIA